MTKTKQLNIGVLLYGCGHHQAAWLMPDSAIEEIGESGYYQRLAQLAEAGCLDAVFFADNQSFPAASATELPAFWLDPLINLTAISQVTRSYRVSFNDIEYVFKSVYSGETTAKP